MKITKLAASKYRIDDSNEIKRIITNHRLSQTHKEHVMAHCPRCDYSRWRSSSELLEENETPHVIIEQNLSVEECPMCSEIKFRDPLIFNWMCKINQTNEFCESLPKEIGETKDV
jgi:hypothetical protein